MTLDDGCEDLARSLCGGETVLIPISGSAELYAAAARAVGPGGRVIAVEASADLLREARRQQPALAEQSGSGTVEFRRGRVQDLQLDLERLEEELTGQPVQTAADWLELQEREQLLRRGQPLVADGSVDVILCGCELNQVPTGDRQQMFSELFRVLRRGGQCVLSAVVSDEQVPAALQQDPQLWSAGLGGAWREDLLLAGFEQAGFYGMEIVAREDEPRAVIQGIEFHRLTLRAFKGKQGPCFERHQAVIYNGPWKAVIDDDGHRLERGQRMAVCDKTYQIYTRAPYAGSLTALQPPNLIPLEQAEPFDCRRSAIRSPAETRRLPTSDTGDLLTVMQDDCCSGDSCC